jgi:hypothetical protein
MKKIFFGVALLIILIAIFSENKEEKTSIKLSENKVEIINPNDISTFGINVSKRSYPSDPTQIFIQKNESNFYVVEINKPDLKENFTWENNNNKWADYENWSVRVNGIFEESRFSLEPVPECKDKCYVSLKIKKYDEKAKKAIFNISVKLINETKYMATKSKGQKITDKDIEIIGFDDLEIEITNTDKKPYFDNLVQIEKK